MTKVALILTANRQVYQDTCQAQLGPNNGVKQSSDGYLTLLVRGELNPSCASLFRAIVTSSFVCFQSQHSALPFLTQAYENPSQVIDFWVR